jgi:hypothetical protein
MQAENGNLSGVLPAGFGACPHQLFSLHSRFDL